jgi:hypothetical protein
MFAQKLFVAGVSALVLGSCAHSEYALFRAARDGGIGKICRFYG